MSGHDLRVEERRSTVQARPARQVSQAGIAASILDLQRMVGNHAVAGLLRTPEPPRPTTDIERDLGAVARKIGDVRSVADDLVEQELGHRPARPGKTHAGLKGVEKRGGSHAQTAKRLRETLEELERREEQLRRELTKARAAGLAARSDPKYKDAAKNGPERTKTPKTPKAPADKPPARTPPTPTRASPPPAPVATAPPVPPDVVRQAAKEASGLRSLAGRVGSVARNVLAKVAGPIAVALQIVDALELIEMSEKAMRGGGFIFRDQIAQAAELRTHVSGLVRSYGDDGFHANLAVLVRKAHENDERYMEYATAPQVYWGTEELSEWCMSVHDSAAAHVRECEKLQQYVTGVATDVSSRRAYCKAILANPAMMTALSVPTSAPAARVWMAHLDLGAIDEDMRLVEGLLAAHLTMARADAKTIDDNILQRGLIV